MIFQEFLTVTVFRHVRFSHQNLKRWSSVIRGSSNKEGTSIRENTVIIKIILRFFL